MGNDPARTVVYAGNQPIETLQGQAKAGASGRIWTRIRKEVSSVIAWRSRLTPPNGSPNLNQPGNNINNNATGEIRTLSGPRIMQMGLRLTF